MTDLHRDSIDHLLIPSKQGKGMLHRVPEVFDCWFESGSMPYAQQHYPFENKEVFGGSARAASRVGEELPRAVHRRGPRPDARLVLHADGAVHGAVQQARLQEPHRER